MKSCPVCHSTYPRDFTLCPRDGTKLVEIGVWTEGTLVRGKYRILGKIGEGGMAAVFKALHVRFEELRALKVISSDLSSDPSFVKRLQQEAVVTRRLQHPNAVRVEDIDEAEDGRPFIVMEYIEGRSLKDVIEEAPLPVERTCRIIKQVASALDAAHALGILHRDIKPANIVLIETPEGEQAKVLDFGIAKVKEANLGETAEMTLTGKGRVVGTSAYMSPEQAMGMRGEELDGRSDLYSLGVVMYQMLVGELPLKAESEVTMLMAHIQRPPEPILALRPDLPKFVAGIVMRLLEKKRESRPASDRALIEEIERWEMGEVFEPTAVPQPDQTILYRGAFNEEAPVSAHAEAFAEAGAEEGTRRVEAFPGAPAPSEPPAQASETEAAFEHARSASAPNTSEPLPEVEATTFASGFGAGPVSEPTPSRTPTAGAPEPLAGGEATVLASGFGFRQDGSSAPPVPIADASEPLPGGEATTFASGFGARPEGERAPEEAYSYGRGGEATMPAAGFGEQPATEAAPSLAPATGTSSAEEGYPGGATMLAAGFRGEPQGASEFPADVPPRSPEATFPQIDATRLASGASIWEAASAVATPRAEAPAGPPAPRTDWGQDAQAGQAVPPVEGQAAPARKSNWAVWAAVPIAAIALGAGAWYFLTQGIAPQVSSPPAPTSTAPPRVTPQSNPPATSGSAQQPSQQPASGSSTPVTSAPAGTAEGAAAGAGSKPEEAKPAQSESKPAEKKPVDTKAIQALKAKGDMDYDQGKYDDAIRAYRSALKLDPGNKVLTQQIARVKKAQETEKSLLK